MGNVEFSKRFSVQFPVQIFKPENNNERIDLELIFEHKIMTWYIDN